MNGELHEAGPDPVSNGLNQQELTWAEEQVADWMQISGFAQESPRTTAYRVRLREDLIQDIGELGTGFNLLVGIHDVRSERQKEITTYKAAVSLDSYLDSPSGRIAIKSAREHQAEALGALCEQLIGQKGEAYLDMATSTGKTFIIAKLAEAFYHGGLRTLILAPTKTIADQIVGESGEKGLGMFAKDIPRREIGRQFDKYKASEKDHVVVATYQGLNRFGREGRLGEFDVILADEAHRSLGNVTSETLQQFFPGAVKLGFTATPDFGDNKRVAHIYGDPAAKLDVREAINRGIAAPLQCLTYLTDEVIPNLDNLPDFTQRELEKLINLKSRNSSAVNFATDFIKDGRQGIISCLPGENLSHARILAEELSAQEIVDPITGKTRNVIALAVGSHLTKTENEWILREYERGGIDVLTFVTSLTEGWDSDRASFLINTCPTTSLVKITQQMGRVIRKKPDGKDAIVVDFLDYTLGKRQATALAVLGEDTFQLGTVYSSNPGDENDSEKRKSYLKGMLSPELWAALADIDATKLSELFIGGDVSSSQLARDLSPEEELQRRRFERILRREGMPADLGSEIRIPQSRYKEIGKILARQMREIGDVPTADEFAQELVARGVVNGNAHENAALAMAYATLSEPLGKINFDHLDESELPDGEDISIDIEADALESDFNQWAMSNVEAVLQDWVQDGNLASKRRAVGIALKWGLRSGTPLTYADTSRIVDISAPSLKNHERKLSDAMILKNRYISDELSAIESRELMRDSLEDLANARARIATMRRELEAEEAENTEDREGDLLLHEIIYKVKAELTTSTTVRPIKLTPELFKKTMGNWIGRFDFDLDTLRLVNQELAKPTVLRSIVKRIEKETYPFATNGESIAYEMRRALSSYLRYIRYNEA